jgi:citrate lyase subunit beta / citryl-CoA lyase
MGREGWNSRLQFGGVTIAMVIGLAMQDTGENAVKELSLDRIRLKSPVFHGDTLYAYTEVLATDDGELDDAGIVTFKHWGVNQRDSGGVRGRTPGADQTQKPLSETTTETTHDHPNRKCPSPRARRCQLSVPGSSEKMLSKAAGPRCRPRVSRPRGCGGAQRQGRCPRQDRRGALNGLDWQAAHAVRAHQRRGNTLVPRRHHRGGHGAGEKLDTIMLTKAKRAADVVFVHLLLDQLEQKLGLKRRIGIECLIEEVEGMMHVEEIAACSDRLECLIFGMGDYSASQQMQLGYVGSSGTYPPDVWHYPRYKMTIACHANGIDPVDGPYANFRNPEGYTKEAERAYVLGMVGKWAIHPNQVELANAVFTPMPTPSPMPASRRLPTRKRLWRGEGAINVDGVMVDAASIRIVQNLIDRADLIGM